MRTAFLIPVLALLTSSVQAQTLKDYIARHPIQFEQTTVTIKSPDETRIRIEQQRQEQERRDRDALNMASWVYISSAAADWSVTAVCAKVLCLDRTQTGLFLHGVENERAAIPLGLAIDAAILFGVREFIAPDYPKVARMLFYVLSGARIVVLTTKVNDLRERARRQ